MKVHQQFPRGFWDLHLTHNDSAACNRRLRPLTPKLPQNDVVAFISPTYLPPLPSSPDVRKPTPQVETQVGGTRWNPTQEQIGILEMLYSRGMRTPNSQQIEQIAVQLSKFGKIEGKNVFYWFQNHKARERQKLKRLTPPKTTSFLGFDTCNSKENSGTKEQTTSKRKCTSWTFENFIEESSYTLNNMLSDSGKDTKGKAEENGVKKTLELFPLHPEGK